MCELWNKRENTHFKLVTKHGGPIVIYQNVTRMRSSRALCLFVCVWGLDVGLLLIGQCRYFAQACFVRIFASFEERKLNIRSHFTRLHTDCYNFLHPLKVNIKSILVKAASYTCSKISTIICSETRTVLITFCSHPKNAMKLFCSTFFTLV